MAIISISDSQVNGADQVLVADSNSKIPAKDGSQITILSATNVATGTIASARLDTGTTANKLVLLDGSGNLPAVDASLLTGIVSATISASDPTISTNPSGGVGTEWNNSTSGEMYICTDATAGANKWISIGGGSGDIVPWAYQGTVAGYVCGGNDGTRTNRIQKFTFPTDASATDVSDLTVGRSAGAGANDGSYGYVAGGFTGSNTNVIDRFQLNTTNNATDVGDLVHAFRSNGGATQGTYGWIVGGYGTAREDSIEKWQLAASANATDVGNLAQAVSNAATNSSTTHGYNTGGWDSGQQWNIIAKWSFSTDGNSIDVGDLPTANEGCSGTSSSTHGYVQGGGGIASLVNTISKQSFASDGNASNVGNTTVARYSPGQSNNSTTQNEDNTVDIDISLKEGEQYYFGEIKFIGNTIYNNKQLFIF